MSLELGYGDYSATLDASASASANSAYVLPVADGDVGQVLQTDGSGVLSWTTPLTLQGVYPVGSVYMTTGVDNPQTTFGFGTWVEINQTTFPTITFWERII